MLTGLGFVIATVNAAIRVLFAMGREQALPGSLTRMSSRHTPVVAIGCAAMVTLVLGLPLTYAYGGVRAFGYLAAAGGLAVVLVYFSVNIAVIRAFRTEFRDQFRLGRHLLIPATASVIFLFPLWGIVHPPAYTLVNLLPFAALGWLCLGVIAAGVLRIRRPPASRDGAQSSCQRTGNQQEWLTSAGARQRALADGSARQPNRPRLGSIFLRRRAGLATNPGLPGA